MARQLGAASRFQKQAASILADSRDWTWYAYDTLGRVTRTVQNSVGLSSDLSATDPRSENYVLGADADRDFLTRTHYDTNGRVQRTQEVKDPTTPNNHWTVFQYDSLGRVTREIRNAANTAYHAGNWSYLSGYGALSPDADKDLATRTTYDPLGRVLTVTDEKAQRTRYTAYDRMGRVVVTVENYVAQGTTLPATWTWNAAQNRWEDGAGAPIDHGQDNDRNLIATTRYDVNGRALSSRDPAGVETRTELDRRGRPTNITVNRVDGVYDASKPDEDRITLNTYHKAGYLLSTTDPLGGVTQYAYDRVGRQISVTRAFGTPDAVTDYTCYDKTGAVLRVIRNYVPVAGQSPDKRIGENQWQFNPTTHGPNNDQNRITEYRYDLAGRLTQTLDPIDDTSLKTYDKRGRVITESDSAGNVMHYTYDRLNRVTTKVQNYLAQGITLPAAWVWNDAANRWENGSGAPIDHSTDNDRNLITRTTYAKSGLWMLVRHADGRQTYTEYDRRGQVLRTIDDATLNTSTTPPTYQGITTHHTYAASGDLASVTNPRGMVTSYAHDGLGRVLSVTVASGTALAQTTYTCYDRVGNVLRSIEHYQSIAGQHPNARTAQGGWVFNPTSHGADNDQNRISEYRYDRANRQTEAIDPLGRSAQRSYDALGRVLTETDPLGRVTLYRYDRFGLPVLVIQNYIAQGSNDPAQWVWNVTPGRWEDGSGNPIQHGTRRDQNLIVRMSYDRAQRMIGRRDPRGHLTQYAYDPIDRRTALINPLGVTWLTSYSNQPDGRKRVVRTMPGANAANATPYTLTQEYDRAQRLQQVSYGDAANTPDVRMGYGLNGLRAHMTELGVGGATVRRTQYTYDTARRLTEVRFDHDGNGTADQTVTYAYDNGGLPTLLQMSSGQPITYQHDTLGRMTQIAQGTAYQADFTYTQANRVKTAEQRDGTPNVLQRTTRAYDVAVQLTQLKHELVAGGTPSLMAQYDYTYDALGNRTQAVEQWQPTMSAALLQRTIGYTYDSASRLTDAGYTPTVTSADNPALAYYYAYDLAGNRIEERINGAPRLFTYNAANQLTQIDNATFSYDPNGNLLQDDQGAYGWDRADRLRSMGGVSYAYDGDGNRISRTQAGASTRYVLDVSRQLPTVLAEVGGSGTTYYIHGPTGVLAQSDGSGWQWLLADAQGNTRVIANTTGALATQTYSPYGQPLHPALQSSYGYTGEPTDPANGLVYLRARHLSPRLGVFPSRDRFEGVTSRPLSLNPYAWVEGNVVNAVDPSGRYPAALGLFSSGSEELTPEQLANCERKKRDMLDAITELERRYDEQIINQGNLDVANPTGKFSWAGHQKQFSDTQNRLGRALKAFLGIRNSSGKGCDDPEGTMKNTATSWISVVAKDIKPLSKPGEKQPQRPPNIPEEMLPDEMLDTGEKVAREDVLNAREEREKIIQELRKRQASAQDVPSQSDETTSQSVVCDLNCQINESLLGWIIAAIGVGAYTAAIKGGGGGGGAFGLRIQ
jgi:RHS repeat-associated protein